MYPNRQKINDVDAGRARRYPSGPTGLWRVPGAHVDAVGGSRGALEWGAVSVLTLGLIKKFLSVLVVFL